MNIDVQKILDYVLPKVESGKEDEAKSLINQGAQEVQKHADSNPLSGLLGNLGLGDVDLSKLGDLGSIVTKLSSLIKPEYLEDVEKFLKEHLLKSK